MLPLGKQIKPMLVLITGLIFIVSQSCTYSIMFGYPVLLYFPVYKRSNLLDFQFHISTAA
jgi:hypothetical protein